MVGEQPVPAKARVTDGWDQCLWITGAPYIVYPPAPLYWGGKGEITYIIAAPIIRKKANSEHSDGAAA